MKTIAHQGTKTEKSYVFKKYFNWDLKRLKHILQSDETTFPVTGNRGAKVWMRPGIALFLPEYFQATVRHSEVWCLPKECDCEWGLLLGTPCQALWGIFCPLSVQWMPTGLCCSVHIESKKRLARVSWCLLHQRLAWEFSRS